MDKAMISETLDVIIEKFRKIDLLNQMDDKEGIGEILETISDFEIRVIENLGKSFLEMAEDIRYLKNCELSEL